MSRQRRPRLLSGAFGEPGSVLAELRGEAERLRRQETVLWQALPEPLRGHCRLARISRDALVVITDSSAWGNRLRFLGPELCEAMRETLGYRPRRLQVRVTSPPPEPSKPTPRRLSEQAGRHLESAARVQSDPRLRQALLRLSKRR